MLRWQMKRPRPAGSSTKTTWSAAANHRSRASRCVSTTPGAWLQRLLEEPEHGIIEDLRPLEIARVPAVRYDHERRATHRTMTALNNRSRRDRIVLTDQEHHPEVRLREAIR